MLAPARRQEIAALVRREVVPAIGCTEPIAVALCTARATETLGCPPEKIAVQLSANILKNAMGVGIPGTGMIGLPIAIALGTLVGKSSYGLEVLRDCTSEAVVQGRSLIDAGRIDIGLKENITEKLYIEVTCTAAGHTATAVISGGHTRFVRIVKDGDELLRLGGGGSDAAGEESCPRLDLRTVWEYADSTPLEELEFILKARDLNKAAAEASLRGQYGHGLGRILCCARERQIMGDHVFSRILSYTSAACDARMAGAMIPVMSNSGSGNQGIAATLPVVVYAEEIGADREALARALMLSHLTAIYIKQSLGRLSALCGCVVASTGSSCGITRLMGGDYDEIIYAVKNMIATLTGMICDGAKPSCALKLTSGVSTATFAALMAMEHKCVTPVEGIIDEDVDRCIANLTRIGAEGMNETDRLILDIMTHKGNC